MSYKKLVLPFFLAFMALGIVACSDDSADSAEDVGESIDQSMEDAGDAVDDATN